MPLNNKYVRVNDYAANHGIVIYFILTLQRTNIIIMLRPIMEKHYPPPPLPRNKTIIFDYTAKIKTICLIGLVN